MKMGKITKSRKRCPFCYGQKWYCWDLFFNDEPDSIENEIPYVDFVLAEFGNCRDGGFVDECVRCGAFAL